MENKFGLFLLLIMYLTFEIMVMFAMASLLAKGQIIFATITMYGVHYYASKTSEIFEELIN